MQGRHSSPPSSPVCCSAGPLPAAIIALQAELNGANEIPTGRSGRQRVRHVHDRHHRNDGDLGDHGREYRSTVVAAHIHIGDSTVNGDVRIDFAGAAQRRPTTDADAALVAANPSGWYVNVHTDPFEGGAVRGQLHHVRVAEPGSAGLLLLGLIGVAWLRRRA